MTDDHGQHNGVNLFLSLDLPSQKICFMLSMFNKINTNIWTWDQKIISNATSRLLWPNYECSRMWEGKWSIKTWICLFHFPINISSRRPDGNWNVSPQKSFSYHISPWQQRFYTRWLDKRIYNTKLKFWAALGSWGCREKKLQLP